MKYCKDCACRLEQLKEDICSAFFENPVDGITTRINTCLKARSTEWMCGKDATKFVEIMHPDQIKN